MPYIQYGGVRYVVDRMKYNYYRAVSLNNIIYNSEVFLAKIMLVLFNNLLQMEKLKKETGKKLLKR